jgi:hypothetical protein
MIVDTGADLNIYLETGEDGERKDGCSAPATAGACDDSGAAPVPASSGCCVSAGVVPQKTDLNEFVGKSGGS